MDEIKHKFRDFLDKHQVNGRKYWWLFRPLFAYQ